MRIFVINGMPRAGKDTFVSLCSKHVKCINMSTVDYVKEIAANLGWDGVKDARGRKFLASLKDILTEYDDIPFKQIVNRVDAAIEENGPAERYAIFIHCREPKEIEKLRKELDATTIIVRREEIEDVEQSNSADLNVFNYEYDLVIDNNSSLEWLEVEAINFVNKFVI